MIGCSISTRTRIARPARRRGFGRRNRPSGSALILALWALFFLAALALAVGAHVAAVMDVSRRLDERVQERLLAEGALARAIMEAHLQRTNVWDGVQADAWNRNPAVFGDVSFGPGTYAVRFTMEGAGGGVVTNVGIIGENGKINLNDASSPLLTSLLQDVTDMDTRSAGTLAEAIVEWRNATPSDQGRSAGLDPAAGEGLSTGSGRRFRSVYELLLVPGMDADRFRRLKPHVTVYDNGKINLNIASATVLTCLGRAVGGDADIAESLARKVVSFRNQNSFANPTPPAIIQELRGSVPLLSAEETLLGDMLGYMTLNSRCFAGTAEGNVGDGGSGTIRVDFVFDRDRGIGLYWHEY